MKSLCIKSNNTDIIIYLLDKFQTINLDDLYVTNRKFRLYENVIVHYNGDFLDSFYDKVTSILSDTIICFFEDKLIKRILEYNYFYFTPSEKRQILDLARDFLEEDAISREDNFFSVYYSVLDYITNNKSIVLDGFVNFRLQSYMKDLDYVVDISVNKFLIEKEYNEFINILKMYVSFTPFNSPLVHLIYHNGESTLLDIDRNVISTEDNALNAKYLSDITFSSNDYALNTLLNLTPKKLIIHLSNGKEDEFITTLKKIFEDRCEVCNDCNVCNLYKRNLSLK